MKRWVIKARYYLKIFCLLFKLRLQDVMAYPGDFFLTALATGSYTMAFLFFMGVVFSKVPQVAGWTFDEMLLFFAVNQFWFYIFWALFGDNLHHLFAEAIRTGELDLKLSKPINTRFLTSIFNPDVTIVPSILYAVGILVYALGRVEVQLTFVGMILFILLFVNSLFLTYNLSFLFACSAFWVMYPQRLMGFLFEIVDFSQYPRQIFSGFWLFVFTFVLPVTLITYLPASVLFNLLELKLVLIGVLISVVIFLLSQWVWRQGLKRYSSASS